MKLFRIVFLFGMIWLGQPATAQQIAPASLRGMVVSAGSNAALTKANVELVAIDGTTVIARIVTDSEGQFILNNVRPGTYRLKVRRDGYIPSEYGQQHPGGPYSNMTLAPGQSLTNVHLAMTRGGVISGHITDRGKPVGVADVVAVKISYVDGVPRLTEILSAKTDDLGAYHIFWLPPGRYYIVTVIQDSDETGFPLYVSPGGSDLGEDFIQRRTERTVLTRAIGSDVADSEAHVPIYYPGTPDPLTATAMDIRPGSELRNIDIDASPRPIHRVRGRITGLPPSLKNPPFGILFRLGPRFNATEFDGEIDTDLSGNFEIPRVYGGSYMLFFATSNEKQYGRLEVTVRDQDLDVVVPLTEAMTIDGHLTVEPQADAAGPKLHLDDFEVIVRADAINEGDSESVHTDGSFSFRNIPTWDYRILVSPLLTPAGKESPALPPAMQTSYVKSIRLGEQDVLNNGLHIDESTRGSLEILIATDAGSVEGRVFNDQRQPLGSIWVSLLPDSSLRYHINHKFVATDAAGRFQFQGVAPGDYHIFAIEGAEIGSWQDPGFMRDYESRGTAVRISPRENTEVDVVAIPLRN